MPLKEDALEYHSRKPAGKLEITPTKPCSTQRDLALAYTPGVAEPCRAIQADPDEAYRLTARGNLVAVVTNGTAVLGLGDIGPLAGKPVMEGKALLFKRFSDIDAIDLELATKDAAEIIRTVQVLEPTFGGINLEDIKAPECFEVEETLKRTMSIPVFHDDQHGTAIISGAALVNALEVGGQEHRGCAHRLQRRGRVGNRHGALLPAAGRAAREHHDGRQQGRDPRGPHRRYEPVEERVRGAHRRAHARRGAGRARMCLSASALPGW